MRTAAIYRVLLSILWMNLAVAVVKALYGVISGSLAVTSDSFHSLLDAASNVVGMLALRMAASPPDRGHPYGHQKIEIVAASIIGFVIAAGSVKFAASAVAALLSGHSVVHVTATGFLLVGATLVVNIVVATYEARRGRELGSPFLLADAAHTASDVIVTSTVLISLLATKLGITWADPIGALVVLLVVAHVAWRILSANLGILLDRAVIDVERVKSAAVAVPGVSGCHRIRSRGVEGASHLDLHLVMSGELTLAQAHEISHQVELKLKMSFSGVSDVVIHVEPEGEPEEDL